MAREYEVARLVYPEQIGPCPECGCPEANLIHDHLSIIHPTCVICSSGRPHPASCVRCGHAWLVLPNVPEVEQEASCSCGPFCGYACKKSGWHSCSICRKAADALVEFTSSF